MQEGGKKQILFAVEDVNTKIRYLRILFTCDMEKLNNNKNKRGPGADEMKNPGMENKDKEDDFSDDMEYFGESEDMMSPTSEAFEDFGSPDTPISSTSREITPIPPIRRLEKSKLQETELKNVAVNTLRAIQNTLHNDYLHFGQFIAESIEKLPALKAKICRHGVLKLLMQIEDEED